MTYNQKHRKTYDTICLLKAQGYKDVKVYAQPMTYEKKIHSLVKHRPELIMDVPAPEALCANFGYKYIEGAFDEMIKDENAIYLLCGAGLISQDLVRKFQIINSHPGYIPYARGLDAYKWSVFYDFPLGVTTHFLGEYIDAGEMIERREICVEPYDTFHSVAQRIYENEIDMLVGAIKLVDEKHEYIKAEQNVFKRMPNHMESRLFDIFQERENRSRK